MNMTFINVLALRTTGQACSGAPEKECCCVLCQEVSSTLTFQGWSCLLELVQLSMICLAGTLSSQTNQTQFLQTARP